MSGLPRTPSFDPAGRRAPVTRAGRGIGLASAAPSGQVGVAGAIRPDGGTADAALLDVTDLAAAAFFAARPAFDLPVDDAGTDLAGIKLGPVGRIADSMGAIRLLASPAFTLMTGTTCRSGATGTAGGSVRPMPGRWTSASTNRSPMPRARGGWWPARSSARPWSGTATTARPDRAALPSGRASAPFLRFGDRVTMEARTLDDAPPFGRIDQRVVRAGY